MTDGWQKNNIFLTSILQLNSKSLEKYIKKRQWFPLFRKWTRNEILAAMVGGVCVDHQKRL